MMTTTAHAEPISPPRPSLHLPDVVRGVMPLVTLGVVLKYTLLNPHLLFGVVAWISFFGAVALTLVTSARIVLVDAPAPREARERVERTRLVTFVQEIVMAGTGGFLLLAPAMMAMATTSREVWAGHVQPAQPSLFGFAVSLAFAVAGLMLVFWRPQFVLDRAAGTIVRYPFARSLPVGTRVLPYAELVVYSERHVHPSSSLLNRDIIRGQVRGNTFELEILRGDYAHEIVQGRTARWAQELGARYLPHVPVDGAR